MPSAASHTPESRQTHEPRTAPVADHAAAVLEHYLRDVRRFPRLSHERERALSQHLQERRQQWRHLLLDHLVHVPLADRKFKRPFGATTLAAPPQRPPPAATPCLQRTQRGAAAPPERPAARWSAV